MNLCEIARMKITNEILPLAFENEITENGDKIIIRSNIESMTEINEWVKEFGVRTNTKWTVRSSWPEREKFVCKKLFVCHHSSYNKVPAALNKKGKSKNTDCLASILVKIKLNTFHVRRYDEFVKKGLVGVITISPFHNHSLEPAETINFNPTEECKIKKEDSSKNDWENISSTSQSLRNITSYSSENSILTDCCRKNERLFGKIKIEDSVKDHLENVSFDSTTVYNSESHLITANHSSEKRIQADIACQKKELSEELLDLLGNGLEKFDASESALESAVKQLEKISSEEEWEAMLRNLGSTVPSKEVLEEAIMAQYVPIAPKPIAGAQSYRPIGVTKGNKRFACNTPSIESPAMKGTQQTIYVQLPTY